MRVLKWTSVVEYIDGETGEILPPSEVKRHYIIIKKTKDYEFFTKMDKKTREIYKECKIHYLNFCTRHGKQLGIFDD